MNIHEPHNKIQTCISHMISGGILPFYGEFNLFVNFIKDSTIMTCGVNLSDNGMNFYWNQKFLDKLPQKQLNFIFVHETYHLLFNHPERSEGYIKDISNIAQDMIINKIIIDDIVKTNNPLVKGFMEIPSEGITAILPPIEYKGNLIFEELYYWLLKEYEDYKKNKSNKLSKIFDEIQLNNGMFLDKHIDDCVSKEYRDQFINEIKTKLKNRGLLSHDIIISLNKLQKSHRDYLKYIKRGVINQLFGDVKYSTILRPNRKGINGLKGYKKLSKSVNCILDTSNSMKKEIDYVLSFIFQNNIEINLIQIDTKIKKFDIIKNMNQLQKTKIIGGGGTSLTPAIKYIEHNKKLNKLNTVILTDGYCENFLDLSKLKKVLILSSGKTIKTKGNVKIILISLINKIKNFN